MENLKVLHVLQINSVISRVSFGHQKVRMTALAVCVFFSGTQQPKAVTMLFFCSSKFLYQLCLLLELRFIINERRRRNIDTFHVDKKRTPGEVLIGAAGSLFWEFLCGTRIFFARIFLAQASPDTMCGGISQELFSPSAALFAARGGIPPPQRGSLKTSQK